MSVGTAGLIGGEVVDGVPQGVSNILADQVDSIVADKLENSKKDKLAIEQFRIFLESVASSIADDRPVVFIIDEMDRCRPDFALDLLENIKHLFSVKGITFLLVLNKKQMESSVVCRYGAGVESGIYLEKFIDLWISLSKKKISNEQNRELVELFFEDSLEKMTADHDPIKKPSYRQIKKILTYYAIFENVSSEVIADYQQAFGGVVCILKVLAPDLLIKNMETKISSIDIVEELGIGNIQGDAPWSIELVLILLEYNFGNDEKKQEIRSEYGRNHIIPNYRSQHCAIDLINQIFVDFASST